MSKGVASPWAKEKPASAQDTAERLIDETIEGAPRREYTFDGRAFQIIAGFYSFDRDMGRLSGYAHDALGRAIEATLKVDSALAEEFSRQSIFLDAAKVLAAKVTVKLGPVTLYVKASSFDPKMAQLMAVDRIALALADARGSSKKVRKSLEDYDVMIARKA